ncbi:type I restriction enzyme R subunit [Cryobacterium mesophilum]|uniref:Type I restriction enzyme endonuclease subunit n=1 Tax=Terrimesophilobacter mesophilus TaxID=433647 RepID=A0A4R8VAB2_9MICO|nr:type I restriction endonuclease subunit R [Terrimesophilobacter mesophilus]MBB5633412.1 type I restriction enzyme R subunit [Terrimesophilobacter mesophilus]TFB80134.1 type I restriction endonuclease subunit R [Terrimesophilobacter mesophilus]
MNAFLIEADVENLVLEDLAKEGWEVQHGGMIAPGELHAERDDYRDVVLVKRLRVSVVRLNPDLPPDAVDDVVNTVLRADSQVVMTENWRGYQLLTQGVPVEYRDGGELRTVRARLVDWQDAASNDLLAVNQFTVQGVSERRPDVVLFLNGLPVVVLELKRPGEENATVRGAFNQIRTYVQQIPDLFTWNQVTVISDGHSARAGTFSAPWEHFAPWKTIHGELAPAAMPQLEVLTRGMLNPARLLDLIQNFVVFTGEAGVLQKKIAKYHQFWAVNKAVFATVEAVEGDGRAGVVWHTQGSGKSLEMEWYAGKVMRHPAMENPTIVVLTDRNDLDDQLFDDTFAASMPGAPLPELPVQAGTRAELKELLAQRAAGGIIFSTIQKFGLSKDDKDAGTAFPLLSARNNIVVMVDEAHRSNYDFIDGFARHLRDGLPNATFIGFTGTPIESTDRSTKQVFGDYIDTYDLTQAVDDGATVKVYYEPRLARVELPPDALGELDDAFAQATSGSEEDARERLKSRWARVEAIVGSEHRIRELAADIVAHWEERRQVLPGKAMIVTMSRRIAAALYAEIARIRPDWVSDDDATGKIKVVITGSAADDELLQPHIRNKAALRALKARAKDPDDELELVIVRDMWLTGFDSPAMHTMYVDKPMKGANLMQAIARVNRTFKDKPAGLVVDYLGIAEDLKSALADYTKRDRQRQDLGQDLRDQAIPAMLETREVVDTILHGFDWRSLVAGGGPRAFLNALTATVEYLLATHPGPSGACTKEAPCVKHRFLAQASRLTRLFTICVPSDEALSIRDDVAFFEAVRGQIAKVEGVDREGGDGAELDTAIRQIVSGAMTGVGVIDIYSEAGMAKPDLSLIDDSFVEKFTKSSHPNLQLELLRRLINDEITRVGKRNVVAGKQFSQMLAESVLRYQNRTLDAAQVVAELVALAKSLKEEAERGANLGLTADELAFYDAIRSNDSAVTELGDDTLKKIAHELVEIVRRDAKTDWSVKEQVRAKLRATIRRLLLRYGYPPDQEEQATQLVLQQAEVLAHAA